MTEKTQLKAELQRIKDRLKEIDYGSRSTLGKNLMRLRTEHGMKQEELALAVGCSRVNITMIERGTSGTSIDRLMKLCDVLMVTPNDLLLESR